MGTHKPLVGRSNRPVATTTTARQSAGPLAFPTQPPGLTRPPHPMRCSLSPSKKYNWSAGNKTSTSPPIFSPTSSAPTAA